MTGYPTEAQVTAAWEVLADAFGGGGALVRDYVHAGMTPAERAAGLARMKAADAAIAAARRDVVRRALMAAWAT